MNHPVTSAILGAAGQAWPPFVLVTGLLMIGEVAEAEGLFVALGARAERLPGGPVVLLAALLSFEAVVTAILNLDTAVVFVTPILLHAARHRETDERAFLYGALFMANGASLLLPGSNLTNLIVLAHEHSSGAAFARDMALPWLARGRADDRIRRGRFPAARGRARLGRRAASPRRHRARGDPRGDGADARAPNAAIPVLVARGFAVAMRRIRPSVDAHVLAGLFAIAVALGTLGRRWDWPASQSTHLGGIATAALGAGAAIARQQPARLRAARGPSPAASTAAPDRADLGPNLAFTGSLSAYLW